MPDVHVDFDFSISFFFCSFFLFFIFLLVYISLYFCSHFAFDNSFKVNCIFWFFDLFRLFSRMPELVL